MLNKKIFVILLLLNGIAIHSIQLIQDNSIRNLFISDDINLTKSDYSALIELDKTYENYGFCFLNPFSGEIKILKNKNIIMERYFAPGSLVKIFSLLAIEKNKLINTGYKYTCEGYKSSPMQCWLGKGHGNIDLTEAIAHSCNAYFFTMLQDCNFTKEMLEKEVRHFHLKYNEDRNASAYEEGIGYGIAVRARPIDLLYAYSSFYNGGLLYDEYGNSEIVDIFSHDVFDIVRDGMRGSYIYGTSSPVMKKTGITDIVVKTGTAVTIENGKENPTKFTGIAIMLYPSIDPKVAIIIALEKGRSSSACAISEVLLRRFFERLSK